MGAPPLNARVSRMRVLAVSLLLLATAGLATEPRPSDSVLARRLVGIWVTDPAAQDQFEAVVTLKADGTGREVVYVRGQPEESGVVVTLRWNVRKGIVTYESVASTDADSVPVGMTLKDRIISLTANRFEYETLEGYYEEDTGIRAVHIRRKS
jgi:hypothetical protein